MASQEYEILHEELSFKGFFRITTLQLRHTLFAGGWSAPLRREVFVRDECVGVLLFDPKRDSIILLEQFRVGLIPSGRHPWLLELVAGIIEPGETPEQVARRETMEESGCEIEELVRVASYYSSPGGSSEYFHLYCGRVSTEGAGGIYGVADEGEDIRVHIMSYDAAMALLNDASVSNAHTMLALQWLQLNKSSLLEQWL